MNALPDPERRPVDVERLLGERAWLRALARQLVRRTEVADEVAHEAIAAAWISRAPAGISPRRWLAAILGKQLAGRRRAQHRRAVREQNVAANEPAPPAADVVARFEVQRAVADAVLALPEPYRTTVLRRFWENDRPAAIAAAMAVPVETVRTRLKRGLVMLRERLDTTHEGNRRAWGLPLCVAGWRTDSVAIGLVLGALLMTSLQKLVAGAVAVGLAALCLWWPDTAAPAAPPAPDGATASGAAPVAADLATAAGAGEAAGGAARREAVGTPGGTGRGDLVVRLLHGDDRSPAADVMVTAFRKHEIPRNSSAPSVDAKRRRTDAQGIARFPSMRAGRTGLIVDRGHWYEHAYVAAGEETEVEWVMPAGVTVTGVVVSSSGIPIAGAEVELESSVVATTGADGRFAVRGAAPHYSIGARAIGHGASRAQQLLVHGGKCDVLLELGTAGGVVEGTAADPDGKPLANVRVDIGRYEGSSLRLGDAPPRPARPRTDTEGRFRAIGIPLGVQQLRARARGFVPWSGECHVTADAPAVVTVVFARGNTLRGTLRDADGRPFGDVLVTARVGELDWEEVVHPDGAFEIDGLPDGEIEVEVDAEGRGEARARVQMQPGGGVTVCELTLACGFVAKGTVRDEAGRPLPNVNVRWTPAPNPWKGYTFTDGDGTFAIANVPDGKLGISLDGSEIEDARFTDLDPRAAPLDLRVKRRAPKTVYISGTVLDADGRPAAARVWASGGGSSDLVEQTTDASGYFEIGPIPHGSWQLGVDTRSFPRMGFERRILEANARWDLGTVRLLPGGDVRVEVVEGDSEGAWFSIQDDRRRNHGLRVQNGRGTSELLPVGSYRLFTSGRTQAAQSIPFEIRAGETTKLDVRVRAGVRQRFDIALPAETPSGWGSLQVARGADVVRNASARREEGKPCSAEVCLDPGDYTVTVGFGELEGSATFTVGEREGEPVRIELPRPR